MVTPSSRDQTVKGDYSTSAKNLEQQPLSTLNKKNKSFIIKHNRIRRSHNLSRGMSPINAETPTLTIPDSLILDEAP